VKLDNSVQYRCSGGLNFISLGTDAALCHHCRVPTAGLEEVLQCPHSDIYTSVRLVQEEQSTVVDYDVQCFAKPGDQHCGQCPEMRTTQPIKNQFTSGNK